MSQLGSIRIGPPPTTRRGFSIRSKIVVLLLAPLVPLLIMTIFTVGIANSPARSLGNAHTSVDSAGVPVGIVLSTLQAERALSVRLVSDKGHDHPQVTTQLAAARQATDGAMANLAKSTSTKDFVNVATSNTKSLLAKLSTEMTKLPEGRKLIDDSESRYTVMTFYNDFIDGTFRLYRSITSIDDHVLAGKADIVVSLAEADEMWSREDALVIGAMSAGVMTNRDYTEIVGAAANQRRMYAQVTSQLSSSDLNTYKQLVSTAKAKQLKSMEDALTSNADIIGQPLNIDPNAWQDNFNSTLESVQRLDSTLATRANNATSNAASSRTAQLWLITGLCILMLAVLIFFSWRAVRTLLRRVAQLRAEALTLALERLPSVVEKLRAGQSVDVEAEAPPLSIGTDELGQLSEAFTRVQHVAVASAVHEATLREGFNQVFLNIARRSQTLLHRQLALLDSMERRSTDPEELDALFRVDHLATRMRRHAEDLVILAGSNPGRGWRTPVAVADVLRAAASEVEEYARINVMVPPNLAVTGRAVNDLVHLLAELLENATLFSPPESQVTLSAQLVPNGFAIEVEDRGLGMTPEAIDEANARLAEPPDFDPAHSSRLGLFVVAKLAERQGINVALRRSAYGGVTAVALVPTELVVAPDSVRSDTIEGAVVPGIIDSRPAAATRVMALAGAVNSGEQPENSEAASRTADGLPIRIRQASVARALPENVDNTLIAPKTALARSPAQMRTMLASFQDGMTMGRKAVANEATHPNAAGSNEHEDSTERGSTELGSAESADSSRPAEESSEAPPLPTRSRHSQPGMDVMVDPNVPAQVKTPEPGTVVTPVRQKEPQSTAENSQPPIARGGGNDHS